MKPIYLLGLAALPLAAPVWAEPTGEGVNGIMRIVHNLQALVTDHIAEIAVLCLVVVGIMWILSFGNEDGIKRANASLRSVIIGLLLIVFATPLVIALLDLMSSVGGVDVSDITDHLESPPAVEEPAAGEPEDQS